MPARKSESDACSVKKPSTTACGIKKPEPEKPRKWADVSKQIIKLRTDGMTVPDIAAELKLNYALVNQHCLRSYKMSARSEEIFNSWESKRLAAE